MKLKDLIGISLVSVFLFPIVLFTIMFAAGVVHLEFGNGKDKVRIKDTFRVPNDVKQEEAEAKQLKAFKAVELKEEDLKTREAEAALEMERLEALKLETNNAKEEIIAQRKQIEEVVSKSSEIQEKQIAALAEVYSGMRPDEAAPILLSLDDQMILRIMRKIPESRSASKLMAALGALDVKRAARITTLLGEQIGNGRSKANKEPTPAPAPESAPEAKKAPAGKV